MPTQGDDWMLTVEGVFDEHKVDILDRVPFTQKKRVLITFLDEPLTEAETAADEVDPIAQLRGRDKGSGLTEKLLTSRQKDLRREESTRKH